MNFSCVLAKFFVFLTAVTLESEYPLKKSIQKNLLCLCCRESVGFKQSQFTLRNRKIVFGMWKSVCLR